MWDIKLIATSKQDKQTKIPRYRQQYSGYQKERGWGWERSEEGKDQIYGNRRTDFEW